jgi:transposase
MPAESVIGLEASGQLWENLEAALGGTGYRVIVLNPVRVDETCSRRSSSRAIGG